MVPCSHLLSRHHLGHVTRLCGHPLAPELACLMTGSSLYKCLVVSGRQLVAVLLGLAWGAFVCYLSWVKEKNPVCNLKETCTSQKAKEKEMGAGRNCPLSETCPSTP